MSSEPKTSESNPIGADGWDIKELWQKYEDIAMHFNDLLIRLRTQALAGVAAISTLVGIFTRTDVIGMRASWEVAAVAFLGLACFWVAIWILDFGYYNKLLIGAVAALLDLEKQSQSSSRTKAIQMSTTVEGLVAGTRKDHRTFRAKVRLRAGLWTFYVVVFATILSGFAFSLSMYRSTIDAPLPRIAVPSPFDDLLTE